MNNDKRIITRIARATKALFLVSMVAMTCACNDFLTITPTDKIVLEDFWKSKEDVESVVAESYRLMTQKDFTYRLLVWGEMRGDNVIEGNGVPADVKNILEANLLPSNSYATWNIFYQIINNCNIVLKYAPGVLDEDPDFTQGDLDVVRGEMLAVRALCHFYLVRAFRDVPLLTEAMVDNSQNLYQAQVTPIEALDQCLSDLYEAENLVLTSGNYPISSNSYSLDQNNKGRITKDAVRTMIADVLLWKAAFTTYNDGKGDGEAAAKACYDECIKYCNLVIDTRMAYIKTMQKEEKFKMPKVILNDSLPVVYPLESSYELVGSMVNRFPHAPYEYMFANNCNHFYEGILEIQHDLMDSKLGNFEVPYFYGCATDAARQTFTPGVLSASPYLALLKNGLYPRTDFRRVNNVLAQKSDGTEVDKFGIIKYGHSGASENRADMKDTDKYTFGKMAYKFHENIDSDGRYFRGTYVNWIVYRISDVMLMKAEALALRNGNADLDEAFSLVATIYNRSQTFFYDEDGFMDGVGEPGTDAIKMPNGADNMLLLIMDERQREFAFEGKRWFDLVRYALYTSKDGSTSELFAKTKMLEHKYTANQEQYKAKMGTIDCLFYPIAEREIDTNSLLEQNEAYKTENKYEKN